MIPEHAPMPAQLTVIAYRDPVIEAHGHRPGSPYVEYVWLGIIGPSTTWAWQRLARQLIASDGKPVGVDVTDLAVSLGLGEAMGKNSMIVRTLHRLCRFGLANRNGQTLAVRTALPDLPAAQQGRLSYSARLAHERLRAN